MPARVAALQDELKDLETRRRAGGGAVPRPAELSREAVALPAWRAVVARAVDVVGRRMKALGQGPARRAPQGVIALGLTPTSRSSS